MDLSVSLYESLHTTSNGFDVATACCVSHGLLHDSVELAIQMNFGKGCEIVCKDKEKKRKYKY